MSQSTYNNLTTVLIIGVFISFALAVAFLIAAIAGWRGPHRTRRLIGSAILLGAIPLLVVAQQLLLWRVFLPSVAREASRMHRERVDALSHVHLGDPAPAFSVTDTDGREFALEDQRGKVVLVNLFATSCVPCLDELPYLQDIWDHQRDRDGFALIAIGREETNESVAAYQSKHGFTLPMAADRDGAIYSLYAQENIPRTYLVSPDGRICFASTHFEDNDLAMLRKEIDRLLESTR